MICANTKKYPKTSGSGLSGHGPANEVAGGVCCLRQDAPDISLHHVDVDLVCRRNAGKIRARMLLDCRMVLGKLLFLDEVYQQALSASLLLATSVGAWQPSLSVLKPKIWAGDGWQIAPYR